MTARTYEIRTYGCQMNVHDSERLAGLLEDAGYVARRDGARRRADLVVFNTCAVRENADNRLYGNLGHLFPAKQRNPGMQIAVGGCLAQKDRGTIVERAPWVDVVFGTHNLGSLPVLLERARHNHEAQVEIVESLQNFPSDLPSRRESALQRVGVDLGRLRQHLHVLHRAQPARHRDRPAARRRAGRDPRRWSIRASSRSRCSGRTSTPTAARSATRSRSASCCAPAARSTAWSGCASPARTRATSPTT